MLTISAKNGIVCTDGTRSQSLDNQHNEALRPGVRQTEHTSRNVKVGYPNSRAHLAARYLPLARHTHTDAQGSFSFLSLPSRPRACCLRSGAVRHWHRDRGIISAAHKETRANSKATELATQQARLPESVDGMKKEVSGDPGCLTAKHGVRASN